MFNKGSQNVKIMRECSEWLRSGESVTEETSNLYKETLEKLSEEVREEADKNGVNVLKEIASFLDFDIQVILTAYSDGKKRAVISTVLEDILDTLETGTYINGFKEEHVKNHQLMLARFGIDLYDLLNWGMGLRIFDTSSSVIEKNIILEGKVEEGVLEGFEINGAKKELHGEGYVAVYENVKKVMEEVELFLKDKGYTVKSGTDIAFKNPYILVDGVAITPLMFGDDPELMMGKEAFPTFLREGILVHG